MKNYNGEVIVNEDFDNPILFSGIEANNENEAIIKVTESINTRDEIDHDIDMIDVLFTNVLDYNDYYNTMPEEEILLDKYGRPYYQTSIGKAMLVKKGGYYYTKD